jgi:hypothetical protein
MYLEHGYNFGISLRATLCAKLCEFRHSLYDAISKDPIKWLNLSCALQSGLIFSEAAIHCIGGFPDYVWPTPWEQLHHAARELLCCKTAQLLHWRMKVDMILMTDTLKSGDESPVGVSSDSGSWFVVSLFRDWLATKMRNNLATQQWQPREMYKLIACGNNAYLPLDDVKESLRTGTCLEEWDSDDEGWDDISNDLAELKRNASKAVAPLLRSQLTIDVNAANIPYLTCMDVKPTDYPWGKKP